MKAFRVWLTVTGVVMTVSATPLALQVFAQSVEQRTGGEGAPQSGGPVARGQYIVEQVAQCGRCHTPVNSAGERDQSRRLMGGPLDVQPTVAQQNWAMVAPRIAGLPPGTDEEFVRLMTTGISRTGQPPMRPMPKFRMTQADAEAVLAFLKSLGDR